MPNTRPALDTPDLIRWLKEAAERIAAATVNQTRTAKGETKEEKSPAERAGARKDMSAAGRKGSQAKETRSKR